MNGLKIVLVSSVISAAVACGLHIVDEEKEEMKLTNEEKVVALLNSIESGDTSAVSFINAHSYTQHNLSVADGLAGFGELLKQLPPDSAKVDVRRVFQDGDYVFAHTEYEFFGPKVGFDIFRFEDGLIVEHWDNLQEKQATSVSGRTQIDGPTQAFELNRTEKNKAIVGALVRDVFLGANPGKISEYISPTKYYQHNPAVADGLDALGAALEAMASAGTPMTYTKNHLILGEGSFVLAVSEGNFLGKHVAFYDLFRLENGKIVEHWDTIENIPPKSEWKHSNGKFGFPVSEQLNADLAL